MQLKSRLNVSFSGCAWFLSFHFGVLKQLQSRGLTKNSVFYGASSGSIVAAAAAADIDAAICQEMTIQLAKSALKRKTGPVFRMSQIVADGLNQVMPQDAHKRIRGRLGVSLTTIPRFKNQIVYPKDLSCNDELKQLILSSCYIPFYYEKTPLFRRRLFIDGGATNNQPHGSQLVLSVCPHRPRKVEALASKLTPSRRFSKRSLLWPNLDVLDELYEEGQLAAKNRWRLFP